MKPVFSLLRLCRVPAFFGCLLTLAAAGQAPVDMRMALVIGDSGYPGNALINPVNDAIAMGAALRGLGFSVLELRDANKDQMVAAVSRMQDASKGKNAIGMLFYAGHGLQLDWRNYMVLIDAKLTKASEVSARAVDVNSVIDAFKTAGNRMNIVVLNACRDNPFGESLATKGLAPMDAPAGTFLAYATAPGNVAEDGETSGSNGLNTRYLLQELTRPVARIEDVFKRVRLNVRQQSRGRQIPWESTSLEDDFYFNDGIIVSPVQLSTSELARTFAIEKQDWAEISASRNAADFCAFLVKYPKGFLTEQARFRLDQVQRTLLTVPPDKVEFNGGAVILDQMGGIKKNRFGVKDPVLALAPADIALGKSWHTAFANARPDGSREENFYDSKVVALEEISALGRTVKAYKVQRKGQARRPDSFTTLDANYWVDPQTMRVVRNDILFRNGSRIVEYESSVLVEIKFATASRSSP